MSAHYMHTLRERDRMNVFLESADGFHMQEDVEKPMVFVSVGTGFAPMRAFLWERLALQRDGVALARPRCSTASAPAAWTTCTGTKSNASPPRECSTTSTSRRRASSRTAASTFRT